MGKLEVIYKKTDGLIPYARNSRTHSPEQTQQIAGSIREFGFTNPILIDEDGGIIAGHGRVMAAQLLDMDEVPTITLTGLTEAQKKAYVIADNKLALNAGWDEDMLRVELEELEDLGYDLSLTGFSEDELSNLLDIDDGGLGIGIGEGEEEEERSSLSDRFGIAPFSVLNARDGWWQDRKKSWIAMGIKSEEGRGSDKGVLFKSLSGQVPNYYYQKEKIEKELGRKLNNKEFEEKYLVIPDGSGLSSSGTSVFDPVICELAYRWFCPKNGVVIDPFAGGSVRGIVAAKLGRHYVGGELRAEQVEANRRQAEEVMKDNEPMPVWINADSRIIDQSCASVKADFFFTCPPYADLEVYSDDPKDLSTLGYPEFRESYFEIIKKACSLLKDNRFACIVVGEVRNKKDGNYYDFVGDTVKAFKNAGLEYYNEAILVTNAGSLAMRVGKFFEKSRKLGKTHQNVLVFVKGDAVKATEACGVCEFGEDDFLEEEQTDGDIEYVS